MQVNFPMLNKADASQYYISRSRYSPSGGKSKNSTTPLGFGSRVPRFRGTSPFKFLCILVTVFSLIEKTKDASPLQQRKIDSVPHHKRHEGNIFQHSTATKGPGMLGTLGKNSTKKRMPEDREILTTKPSHVISAGSEYHSTVASSSSHPSVHGRTDWSSK